MDKVEIQVSSGIQGYNAAVNGILDKYAGTGIIIDYPSGTHRTLEAAVRCCVVTSMNQTAAQITNQYIVEAKSEYVLISAHLGARAKQKEQPDLAGHDLWQGKIYKIRGSEPGYPNLLESTGYDIKPETGEGMVVNPLGSHGYNCRHGHQPWDKGLKNPYLDKDGKLNIDSEENRKRYDLSRKQRSMERSIRKIKRQLIVKQEQISDASDAEKKTLQAAYNRLAYRLIEQNRKYNEFCKENNLAPQYNRNRVADFGVPQQKTANKAARRYQSVKGD